MTYTMSLNKSKIRHDVVDFSASTNLYFVRKIIKMGFSNLSQLNEIINRY